MNLFTYCRALASDSLSGAVIHGSSSLLIAAVEDTGLPAKASAHHEHDWQCLQRHDPLCHTVCDGSLCAPPFFARYPPAALHLPVFVSRAVVTRLTSERVTVRASKMHAAPHVCHGVRACVDSGVSEHACLMLRV